MAGIPLKKHVPKAQLKAKAGTFGVKKVPSKSPGGIDSVEDAGKEVEANEKIKSAKAKETVKEGKGRKSKETSKPTNQPGSSDTSKPRPRASEVIEAQEIKQENQTENQAEDQAEKRSEFIKPATRRSAIQAYKGKWYDNPKLTFNDSCLFPNRKLGKLCNKEGCEIYHKCLLVQKPKE